MKFDSESEETNKEVQKVILSARGREENIRAKLISNCGRGAVHATTAAMHNQLKSESWGTPQKPRQDSRK